MTELISHVNSLDWRSVCGCETTAEHGSSAHQASRGAASGHPVVAWRPVRLSRLGSCAALAGSGKVGPPDRTGPARGRRPVAAARSHAGMGQGYWITGGGGSVAGCRSRPVHAPDPAKLLASRLSASDRGRGFACRVPPLSRGASGLPYQSPVAGRGRVARRLASRVVRPSRRRIASVS
jgi:hypothetical protein